MIKTTTGLLLAASISAFAGTSAKEVIAYHPPVDPCAPSWFVGGSVGYLLDFEEAYFSGHIGTDTCWNVAGWDVALFAEVGYTESDEDGTLFIPGTAPIFVPGEVELEIMPITANVKFERSLTQALNVYLGAGVGAAHADLSFSSPNISASADDWVFAAQVFGGVGFDVSPSFEIYSGARWLYLDDADDFELGDDVIVEVGARYNF